MSVIGRSVTRLEDPPLVRGEGRFAADVNFPRQLHMRVVRSHIAHGVLRAVETQAARDHDGVIAVWTAADVADIPPIDFRLTRIEGLEHYRQNVLASGRVRYVGEPVALVFAEDAYVAEDAADLIELDIDTLDPCLTADGAPVPFDATRDNEPAVVRKGYGDVDAAFAAAHAVVSLDLIVGRHSGVPLETRGAVARLDRARDILELHGAAEVPHWNRDTLALMLGRSPSSIHLYEGHVGGGFGIRGELYPEDVLVCLAALRLGRPVKWIEDRWEHLVAANHSRQQHHKIRAAVRADGTLLAIDDEFWHDQGAYIRTHGATVPDLAAAMLLGPYAVPAYRVAGHVRLTNKTPCGTYRSPGRYETTFVRERLMDAIADRLGMDRIEVRRRNFVPPEAMPYERPLDTLGTQVVLDSGDYNRLIDRASERFRWDELTAELAARRAKGEAVGLGCAFFVEKSGLGPFDGVRVRVDDTGRLEVVTGAASVGQGVETVVAQIAADTLGVAYDQIRVTHGQTDQIRYGQGAFASRVTVMTGTATQIACGKLRKLALEVAANLLQTPAEALTISDGVIHRDGGELQSSVTLAEVARALSPMSAILGDREPGLAAEGWYYTGHMNYPYGIHMAVACVDRDTGGVTVERYQVAYDVGRAINPMLIEGQIAGGVAQGLGGALLEEFIYDPHGQPLAATFADYLMPTIHEVPPIEVLLTEDAPSPLNPLGIKGAGEGGSNAVGAAIAAAIDDALGRSLAVTQLPVTPARLKQILRSPAE